MKKVSFKLLVVLFSMFTVLMFTTTSCDEDPEEVSTTKPVLDVNFTKTQNANTITFNSTLAASAMWVTNTATEVTTDFVDGICEVFIPIKGTYSYTCSSLVGGVEYTSDAFDITIAETDLTFLESGIWKALTGGPNGNKVWKLDTYQKADGSYGSKYFHCALDFYGDEVAGAVGVDDKGVDKKDWGPWGGTNLYGWGSTPEVGTISFDGTTGMATLVMTDGVNADGDLNVTEGTNDDGSVKYIANPTAFNGTFKSSFSMVAEPRQADYMSIPEGDGFISLWSHMIKYKYAYLGSLSDEIGKIKFSGEVRFPLDKGRVGEAQFNASDLKNVKIIHCSDSALILSVKRTYEGFSDKNTKKENSCWLVYNYIVDGIDYPVKEVVQPVKTDFEASDLVGTWKFDTDLPFDWIGWKTANRLNKFTTQAEIVETGWAATQDQLDAAADDTFVFNADGSCTINGTDNTYSVASGKITFGSELPDDFGINYIMLSGKEIYAIDVKLDNDGNDYTYSGIWLGQRNDTKDESKSLHLIKQ